MDYSTDSVGTIRQRSEGKSWIPPYTLHQYKYQLDQENMGEFQKHDFRGERDLMMYD